MAEFIIGLDVGTTSVKAIAFDREWNIHGLEIYPYQLIRSAEQWIEQDPTDLWNGVLDVVGNLVSRLSSEDKVLAIGISTQGGTLIPISEEGEPIGNAISWMDQRALDEKKFVSEKFGESEIYHRSGWQLNQGLPLLHLLWLKNNRFDEFQSIGRVNFVNDYIISRFTGVMVMDPSSASITQLTDIRTGDWDDELLSIAGIERGQLSPIHPSGSIVGKITPEVAQKLNLSEDVLVINGAHDQYCSACATGVISSGKMMLACGTAWVLLVVPEMLDEPVFNGMGISHHAVEGLYGGIYSMGGMGRNLEWFIERFLSDTGKRDSEAFNKFDLLVSTSILEENNPFFFPIIGGEFGSVEGNGGFYKVNISHNMGDLARAVLEGSAYELKIVLDKIKSKGIGIDELIMVGGGAKSPFLPQMVADISGTRVMLPGMTETACRGAAVLAAKGIGWISDYQSYNYQSDNQEKHINPETSNAALYEKRFRRYKKMKEALYQ